MGLGFGLVLEGRALAGLLSGVLIFIALAFAAGGRAGGNLAASPRQAPGVAQDAPDNLAEGLGLLEPRRLSPAVRQASAASSTTAAAIPTSLAAWALPFQPGRESLRTGAAGAEVAMVNQDRSLSGLAPLVESPALDRVALVRAEQLARYGLSHKLPGNPNPAVLEVFRQQGVAASWHGENIIWEGGMPHSEVLGFFNGWWMASADHRANILNPAFKAVGIGMVVEGPRVFMVEVFTD